MAKYPELKGKRALVTGAGKGIGAECVSALISQDCFVVAVSRTQTDLDKLQNSHGSSGLLQTALLDVADWNGVEKLLNELEPVHFVINNAGVVVLKPLLEVTEKEFDTVFDVNIKAAFHVAQTAARKMVESGTKGVIVNVSSQASKVAFDDHATYCCSKAALDMLTKMICKELGPKGIRAVTVNPTVVLTDMGRLAWSDPAKSAPMLSRIPVGRFADIDDVINPILFCLSDGAAMLSGCEIPIEGGFWAV